MFNTTGVYNVCYHFSSCLMMNHGFICVESPQIFPAIFRCLKLNVYIEIFGGKKCKIHIQIVDGQLDQFRRTGILICIIDSKCFYTREENYMSTVLFAAVYAVTLNICLRQILSVTSIKSYPENSPAPFSLWRLRALY